MPAAIATEFLRDYPGFSKKKRPGDPEPPEWLEQLDALLVEIETLYCPPHVWTDPIRQRRAVMLRTAHILECNRQQLAASASIGAAVSTGQAASQVSSVSEDLDQTTWGRQFKQLRKTLGTATGFIF